MNCACWASVTAVRSSRGPLPSARAPDDRRLGKRRGALFGAPFVFSAAAPPCPPRPPPPVGKPADPPSRRGSNAARESRLDKPATGTSRRVLHAEQNGDQPLPR